VGTRQKGLEQHHGQGPEDHRSDAGRRRRRADDGHGLDLVLQPLHVLDGLLQRRGVVGLQIMLTHARQIEGTCVMARKEQQ
jgi:hypothetical protein